MERSGQGRETSLAAWWQVATETNVAFAAERIERPAGDLVGRTFAADGDTGLVGFQRLQGYELTREQRGWHVVTASGLEAVLQRDGRRAHVDEPNRGIVAAKHVAVCPLEG